MQGESTIVKTTGTNAGRPNEIKLSVGLRMYPSDRELIEKHHPSLQKFFDIAVEQELKAIKLLEVPSSQD